MQWPNDIYSDLSVALLTVCILYGCYVCLLRVTWNVLTVACVLQQICRGHNASLSPADTSFFKCLPFQSVSTPYRNLLFAILNITTHDSFYRFVTFHVISFEIPGKSFSKKIHGTRTFTFNNYHWIIHGPFSCDYTRSMKMNVFLFKK